MIIVFLNIKKFFYHSSIIRVFAVINNYVHETGPHVPKYCIGLVFLLFLCWTENLIIQWASENVLIEICHVFNIYDLDKKTLKNQKLLHMI